MPVLCLLLLTAYVVAGRLLMPLAAQYRLDVSSTLAAQLGAQVHIESLEGRWHGLSPVIDLDGLELRSVDGGHLHHIESLHLKLDVFSSLLQREWRFSEVRAQGLDFTVRERDDGSWSVEGVGLGGGLQEAHIDFLLNSGALHLVDARLALQRATGEHLQLEQLSASLYNQNSYIQSFYNPGSRHELKLQLLLPEQPSPLQLSLTLLGDPRDELVADGYLGLHQTEMSPLLRFVLPTLPVAFDSLVGNAALWFSRRADGTVDTTLSVDDVTLSVNESSPASTAQQLEALSGTLRWLQRPDGAWRMQGQTLEFSQDGERWQHGPFVVEQFAKEQQQSGEISISAASLQLAAWQPWLPLLAHLLPQTDIIQTLSPRGRVDNLQMTLQPGASPRFQLQAVVTGLGVNGWQYAPAGDGIDARLEANERGGVAYIDSRDAELQLAHLFADRWYWDEVRGEVYWELIDEGFRVFSSPLVVISDHVNARVQFEVDKRQEPSGAAVADLALNIGLGRLELASRSLYLPAIAEVQRTMDWLDQALQGGEVHDSGIIYRGSVLPQPPPNSQSTIAHFSGQGVELAFQDIWPHITDATADVKLEQGDVDIQVASARLAGIDLLESQGQIRQHDSGPLLTLDISAQADTGTGLDFLRDTPISNRLNGELDEWEAAGQLAMVLDLSLPLSGEEHSPVIDLTVNSQGSRLQMHELDLDITEIDGAVHYSSEAGLSAQGLQGRLFGWPLATSIDTFMSGSNVDSEGNIEALVIRSSGSVTDSALYDWTEGRGLLQRLVDYVEGASGFESELQIFPAAGQIQRRARLEVSSTLSGMGLLLPAPFNKAALDTQPFKLSLDFFKDHETLGLELAETASARLYLQEGQVMGGLAWLGNYPEDLPQALPGSVDVPSGNGVREDFVLLGELEQLDVSAWQAWLQSWSESGTESSSALPAPSQLSRLSLAELDVALLQYEELTFEDMFVSIRPVENGWSLFAENELLSGTVVMPDDDQPWQVDLAYLRLPGDEDEARDEESTEALDSQEPLATPDDALAAVDPRNLPPLDINVAEFRQGERHFGHWALSMRPQPDGALIENLQVSLGNARIHGVDESAPGGRMRWLFDGSQHETHLDAKLEAANLAETLISLGYDAHVESERARFAGNLSWPGSPAAFALQTLNGEILLRLNNGRFVNIDSGSSRLFGALNLDLLVRRLQLDFSDLFRRGFSYDRIDAQLQFDSGRVSTMDRLLISGPSSKIRLEGELDLQRQYIHADMLVSVPLSQNITVLAGLLGAWPIALSTYLAGRIFEDQVEGLTAVAYRLDGPLNDLDTEFVDADELGEVAGEALPPAPIVPNRELP